MRKREAIQPRNDNVEADTVRRVAGNSDESIGENRHTPPGSLARSKYAVERIHTWEIWRELATAGKGD
jgi:hypothetical protein